MSSETSTEGAPAGFAGPSGADGKPDATSNALQPWQFFVLAALGCATAVTFIVRSQGVTAVILVTLIIVTGAGVGVAVLRMLRPLVSPQDDRTAFIGLRTRAGLEQEKALALRTIKELEFDRAMGKLSDGDFNEMSVRLRARASRLIKQLSAADSYRPQIERDLAKRLGNRAEGAATTNVCAACATANERDSRFCKECGGRL